MAQRMNLQQGMLVKSRDGAEVGRVIDVLTDGLLVEKGVFFTRDYHVPFREVLSVQGDEVQLTQTREHLARVHRTEAGESAKLQEHAPQPHAYRAAGPGWDPLTEDEKRAPPEPGSDAPHH